MKLRNKKTGEIIDIKGALRGSDDYPNHYLISGDWEDYEEPNIYYYIDIDGQVKQMEDLSFDWQNNMIELGNRFDTKEEAEKAAEKLKAWKRLKDQGFSIDGWTNDIGDNYYMPSDFVIKLNYNGDHRKSYPDDVFKDLDLLFGGEE